LAIALGIIGGAHATDVLITAFRSGDTIVSEALVLDGEDAVEPLIAILRNRVMTMRLEAVRLLGEIRDGRAVEPLGTALQDEQIQYDAAERLGKIGDDRAVALLSAALTAAAILSWRSWQTHLRK
jgi:HEAT repeat protein